MMMMRQWGRWVRERCFAVLYVDMNAGVALLCDISRNLQTIHESSLFGIHRSGRTSQVSQTARVLELWTCSWICASLVKCPRTQEWRLRSVFIGKKNILDPDIHGSATDGIFVAIFTTTEKEVQQNIFKTHSYESNNYVKTFLHSETHS